MTQEDFLQKWNEQKEIYLAWGHFIRNEIEKHLAQNNPSLNIGSFIKIPAHPRLKEDNSLLAKAFNRNKGYKNPFDEIEDKVGLRFVVLLTTDIDKIQKSIEASDFWTFSLDKDFKADRDNNPNQFGYESKHYVLRSTKDIEYENILIFKNTPCEVQIRTLLQHAHSELTHDTIYKRDSTQEVSKQVQRTVAKSMALIEAVDDYFLSAITSLEQATKVERDALFGLQKIYESKIGLPSIPTKTDQIVLDAFRDYLNDGLGSSIEKLITEKPWIVIKITDRRSRNIIYRQAWILLIYLLVNKEPYITKDLWPFPIEEIDQIYIDFGKKT